MPVSKAQQRAVNKYMSANYDRINLTVAKGQRDTIKAHAEARGESVNGFINRAIDRQMERDAGVPREAAGEALGPVVSLTPEAIKTAQEAAEAAGEDLPQFVTRAIRTQIKEDIEDKKAEEDVIIMLREAIQSGTLPEKNRIIAEETLKSIEAKKGV